MRDNVDCLDYPVREACFDHFSIFVAAPDAPVSRGGSAAGQEP